MELLPEWKLICKKAWSMKFIALATVLSGAEAVLTAVVPDHQPGRLSALAALVTLAAGYARLLAQKEGPSNG